MGDVEQILAHSRRDSRDPGCIPAFRREVGTVYNGRAVGAHRSTASDAMRRASADKASDEGAGPSVARTDLPSKEGQRREQPPQRSNEVQNASAHLGHGERRREVSRLPPARSNVDVSDIASAFRLRAGTAVVASESPARPTVRRSPRFCRRANHEARRWRRDCSVARDSRTSGSLSSVASQVTTPLRLNVARWPASSSGGVALNRRSLIPAADRSGPRLGHQRARRHDQRRRIARLLRRREQFIRKRERVATLRGRRAGP